MDFDRLRAFVWTLEEGGVSAAARRLCRTQPAVTRMLQTLEDQVGARLIDRRARPVRATADGLRVLQHARDILHAADRLTDGGARAAARPALRVGVSRSLVWHLRDPRFVRPAAPLGAVDFVMRSGWSPRLYRRFTRGEFDAAVLLMPRGWAPDVPCRSEVVRSESLAIVVPRPAGAPATAGAAPGDLARYGWILNPDGCGFRHALTRCLAAAGQRPHVQFELDAAPQEHLAMAAAGVGATIVPASALALAPLLAARVQHLSVPRFAHDLRVWLLWAERSRPVPGVAEALAGIFAAPPRPAAEPRNAPRRGDASAASRHANAAASAVTPRA